jgi:hypothetical protein
MIRVLFQVPNTKEESNITLDAHVLNKALQNTLLQLVQMRAMLTGVCIDFKRSLGICCYKCKHIGKIHQEDIKTEDPKTDHAKETNYGINRCIIRKDEEVKK